jgi:hypothetical protein
MAMPRRSKPRGAERRRCTECREWYEAAPSARDTQKVCGAACRQKRRRKCARVRRGRELQQARVDERERQRDHRAERRRRAASPAPPTSPAGLGRDGPTCHAPPSSAKHREILSKVLDLWDNEMARSRATLERRIRLVLAGAQRSPGTAEAGPGALSRATLGP